MTEVLEGTQLYAQEFEKTSRTLPGASLPWMIERRRRALAQFRDRGFPTTDDESWRFTDVSAIAETPFRTACPSDASISTNGAMNDPQSGIQITSLEDSLSRAPGELENTLGRIAVIENHPFAAWNTSSWRDGSCIRVSRGTRNQRPVVIEHAFRPEAEPTVRHLRNLLIVEEDAEATIVEWYRAPESGCRLTNAVTEIVLGPGARLTHVRVEDEGAEAYHVGLTAVRQEARSVLRSFTLSRGALLTRQDLVVTLSGEGAECLLHGLYEGHGTRRVDNHTTIDHAAPRTTSVELYKGVLDGHSRGVFDGRILVRPEAQKTSASQTNRNLLLSRHAFVNTKPQLEILANDVKCRHGATVGQLDDAALFYLRSRGIGEEEARRMLVRAFSQEILDALPCRELFTPRGEA